MEYPLAASEEPCSWMLRPIDGMRCVRCDQCQFGMTSVDSEGNVGPPCKATGFMTNDEYIAEAVDRDCFGGRDHIQLLSGRAKSFEKYPTTVGSSDTACFATKHASRGTRRSTENDGTRSTVDNRSSGGWADSGGAELLSLLDHADGNQEFRDRCTGLPLNSEMVKKAREPGMQCMEELKVS